LSLAQSRAPGSSPHFQVSLCLNPRLRFAESPGQRRPRREPNAAGTLKLDNNQSLRLSLAGAGGGPAVGRKIMGDR
jgi:hypothetical protein